MAKTAKTETKVQKEANTARNAFQKAKEANEKNDNATTQKVLTEAQTVMRAAVKAENRERFINVGNSRTKKARAAIRQLVKVANPKTYDFTADEGQKIVSGLLQAVKDVERAFTSTGKAGASEDDFVIA